MYTKLETEQSKWYSRGAKFENSGILFQNVLSVDAYVENAFKFKAPFCLMVKVCNRTKDSKYYHELNFTSNRGYDLKVSIAGDKDQ